MVETLFVLGPSGSGKSTLSRHVVQFAKANGWRAYAISDYPLLYEMFLADTKREQFAPGDPDYGGFKVLKMRVYDTVLDELNRQVRTIAERAEENTLVTIEFARSDYRKALKHFNDHLLRTAHFLFLDADIETCKRRVRERIICPRGLDDHFVPDHVIECFGQASCKHYIESGLKLDYEINDDRILVLDNNGPLEENAHHIEQFVDTILSFLVPVGL